MKERDVNKLMQNKIMIESVEEGVVKKYDKKYD